MTEYPRLVALCGFKGSGKTTLAKQMVFDLGYQRIPFAETLKLMMRTLLHEAGASHPEIDAMLNGDLKEKPCEILCGKTPRYAMQTLGTEWRNLIGKNLWTEIWQRSQARYNRVVVDDMRFVHEESIVRQQKGVIIKITRLGYNEPAEHISDQELTDIIPNVIISNDSDPKAMLENFKQYGPVFTQLFKGASK